MIRAIVRKRILRFWQQRGRRLAVYFLAFALSFLQITLSSSSFGERAEYFAVDTWFGLRGSRETAPKLYVAAIDDISFQNLGASILGPLPRQHIAKAISNLAAAGAKAVFVDVLFRGPTRKEADQALAKSLAALPTFLARGRVLSVRRSIEGGVELESHSHQSDLQFREQAVGVLPVGVSRDYSIIRRFPHDVKILQTQLSSELNFSLSERAGPSRSDFVNFAGPAGTLPHISIYKLVQQKPEELRELFDGAIVFIGVVRRVGTGMEIKDSFKTPYDRMATPGVEVQATICENLLQANWIERADPVVELAFVGLCCFAVVVLFCLVSTTVGFVSVLIIAASWILAAYSAFQHNTFLPGASFIAIGMPASFCIIAFVKHVFARRQRARVESALGIMQ